MPKYSKLSELVKIAAFGRGNTLLHHPKLATRFLSLVELSSIRVAIHTYVHSSKTSLHDLLHYI